MNRRNIHILNGIIVSFLVLLILGCGERSGNKTATSGGQQSAKYKDSSDGAMQDNDGMLEIVDLAGRTVNIPTGDVKVILGESRLMIYAIAPLFGKDGNPFTHIVGWRNDLENSDPDTYEMYLEKFPEIAAIPNVGNISKDFSLEKAITLNPDIMIMNPYQLAEAQEMGIIKKLEKAGIKTVFIDFGKNIKQIKQNAILSMLLLGQIFEKTDEASKFVNFYFAQMRKVSSIVDTIQEDKKPLVFMESGNSEREKIGEYRAYGYNAWGSLVELAGGRNYGIEIFGSKSGIIVSAEQLFVTEPDITIGTGTNWSKSRPSTRAVLLGYKAQNEDNQQRLQAIISSRPGWETLKAVKNKRVHIIYHRFVNSPYHFIAIQQMAKWIYPEKFADLDTKKTFIKLHDEFLPISYSGQFWISLE